MRLTKNRLKLVLAILAVISSLIAARYSVEITIKIQALAALLVQQ